MHTQKNRGNIQTTYSKPYFQLSSSFLPKPESDINNNFISKLTLTNYTYLQKFERVILKFKKFKNKISIPF